MKNFIQSIFCAMELHQNHWDDYKKWLEKENKSKVVDFSFRFKQAGWNLYPCMA